MNKNNIGILALDIKDDKDNILSIYRQLEERKKDVIDISIFFQRISDFDEDIKCGIFNSSSLSDFEGILICMGQQALQHALSVVNNIKLYCVCDSLNVLTYFKNLSQNNAIKYLTYDENSNKNFFRVTGNNADMYGKDVNIMDLI